NTLFITNFSVLSLKIYYVCYSFKRKMLEKVREYIQKENLILHNTKVIVGLSGGMDSMMLLDILTLLGYSCLAAHCNFHLRGEESNRDEIFVKKWCKSIDIPFTSINFDTNQYASDLKISIEMA